jgi:hypothetical protein
MKTLPTPTWVSEFLQRYEWQFQIATKSWTRNGFSLYIRNLGDSKFAVELHKMSQSWTSMVDSDGLLTIIRTNKPPKK